METRTCPGYLWGRQAVSKRRLRERANLVQRIVGDVTAVEDVGRFDIWHDRAVSISCPPKRTVVGTSNWPDIPFYREERSSSPRSPQTARPFRAYVRTSSTRRAAGLAPDQAARS